MTPRSGLSAVTPGELLHVQPGVGENPPLEVTSGDASKLPVEAVIHAAIYRHRPDVGGIVRDHGVALTVFSITGAPLRPVHALGAVGPKLVPVLDSSELISDWAGGEVLCRVMGNESAVLLRGNGRVVVDATVEDACARALLLEESARICLSALSAGLEVKVLGDDEIASARRDVGSPAQLRRVWDHYRSKHRC